MSQVQKVSLAARVFALAALGSLGLLIGPAVFHGVLLACVVAVCAQAVALTRRFPEAWIAVAEGGVVAVLSGTFDGDLTSIAPYLAIPPLIGGLAGRRTGFLRVSIAESVLLALSMLLFNPDPTRAVGTQAAVWVITGVGLGVLGASMHDALTARLPDAGYRNALDLIKQLHELRVRLSDGLDVVNLADALLAEAASTLPVRWAALFVRGPSGRVAPLRFSHGANASTVGDGDFRAESAWQRDQVIHVGRNVAAPLHCNGEIVVVLVAECLHPPTPETVVGLEEALTAQTLRLYAALLFAEVRASATSDERQRLAREVHDGVAQDVASLGYLIDALDPRDDFQKQMVDSLRREITRVVGELRHSVYDLRNEVGMGRGLGEALSAAARHLGSHSDLTVHLTLDEAEARLRPDVEAELLRIAQEAMTNARKHSQARNLLISCRVAPPEVELVIRDDGVGLGGARDDSHGLKIMRERADRIGANLSVTSNAAGVPGTRVEVTLGLDNDYAVGHEFVGQAARTGTPGEPGQRGARR